MNGSSTVSLSVIENTLVDSIVREWQGLPASLCPWGVWIRKYSQMPPGKDQVDASVLPQWVWFLDKYGLHSRNVWEWQRFYTVHFEQPWCSKFFSMEPVHVFGAGQIGLAAFAPYAGMDNYYLETLWDGRWGHGWEINFGIDNQLLARTELWIA